jgi:hypothetical protein
MTAPKLPVSEKVAQLKGKFPIPLNRDEIVLILMVVLSIVGIAVTNLARPYGLHYWLAMVPVFAACSIFYGWSQARREGIPAKKILRVQLFHWVASALAVYAVYLLEYTGRIDREAAGLVTLLALALTTFLAGVHFNWRFAVLGLMLGLTMVGAAFLQEFFWMLVIPAVVVGGGLMLFNKHGHQKS